MINVEAFLMVFIFEKIINVVANMNSVLTGSNYYSTGCKTNFVDVICIFSILILNFFFFLLFLLFLYKF